MNGWVRGGIAAAPPGRENKQTTQHFNSTADGRKRRVSAEGASQSTNSISLIIKEMEWLMALPAPSSGAPRSFCSAVSESNPTPTTLSPAQARRVVELGWFGFPPPVKIMKCVGYGPEAPLPHNHSAAKKTFLFRYGLFAPSSFFIKEKTSGGVG